LSTQFSPTPSFPNSRAFRIPSPSLGRVAGRVVHPLLTDPIVSTDICCPVSLPKFGEGKAGLFTYSSTTPSFPLICAVQFPSPSLGRAGRGCPRTSHTAHRFHILVLSGFPPQVWGGRGGVVYALLTDPIVSTDMCCPVSLPKFGEDSAKLFTNFLPTQSLPHTSTIRIPSPSLGRAGRGCPHNSHRPHRFH
jgi:hypothetical protein